MEPTDWQNHELLKSNLGPTGSAHHQVRGQRHPAAAAALPKFIVGIGSSAGGIEALSELLATLEPNANHAFVIIQHMSPDFKTLLPEILSQHSRHQVRIIEDGMIVAGGEVYLIPPAKMLTIFRSRFLLEERIESDRRCYFPIDYFFESLAKDCGESSMGIILSGTGTDGTEGIKAIKSFGGSVIVQNPASSKFSGMPKSAIATGIVDAVAPIPEMAAIIADFCAGISALPLRNPVASKSESALAFDRIFNLMLEHHGLDFSLYNQSLTARRIERRSKICGCRSLVEYSSLVCENERERGQLFDDLLLGVTEFNRHPECLTILRDSVFPRLCANSGNKDVIRVWVVGCSTGEEAYTLAFYLADFLHERAPHLDFKIFATDVDERSLRIATRGLYPASQIQNLPQSWQRTYLHQGDGQVTIKSYIRDRVVFANHNIIRDAPFPLIDVISCRNLLIYLNEEAKKKVLRSFQFSLRDQGYLLLSPSEDVVGDYQDFETLHPTTRLFRSLVQKRYLPRAMDLSDKHLSSNQLRKAVARRQDSEQDFVHSLYQKLVHEHLAASLVFDARFSIKFFFGAIRDFCRPQLGKASHDLESFLHEDIFKQAKFLKEQTKVGRPAQETVIFSADGDKQYLVDLTVAQLDQTPEGDWYYLLKIESNRNDATVEITEAVPEALLAQINRLKREIHDKDKQLIEVRNEMAATVGQLEASNEELRTTNEELQAGSEELQSTNEELQAVNEELYTVNAECQMRITELSEMSSDLQNIYDASEIGTVFIDKDLRIRKYNLFAQSIFNFLPDDIGRPLNHFSSSLRVDFLKRIRRVLANVSIYQSEIKAENGQRYLMRMAPYRTEDFAIKGVVIIFLDISSLKDTQDQLRILKQEFNDILEVATDLAMRLSPSGNILWGNKSFVECFANSEKTLTGTSFFATLATSSHPVLEGILREAGSETVNTHRMQHKLDYGAFLDIDWLFRPKKHRDGSVRHYLVTGKRCPEANQ